MAKVPCLKYRNEPYTKEIQNGMRLAACLINVGTDQLRQMFDTIINKKYRTLTACLRISGRTIDSYYHPRGKTKPKLINNQQYEYLYPQQGQPCSSNFDISLFCVLFNILHLVPAPPSTKNWRDEPLKTDTSFSAHVVRLRYIRNRLYGHVSQTGMNDSDFGIFWKELHDVLEGIGSDSNDINKWKTEPLQDESVDYREHLCKSFESDLGELYIISDILMKTIKTCKNRLHVKEDKLAIYMEKQKDRKYDALIDLFKELDPELIHSLWGLVGEKETKLGEKIDCILQELQQSRKDFETHWSEINHVKEKISHLDHGFRNSSKNIQAKLDEIRESICKTQPDNFEQVKFYMERQVKTAFKVLIINEPSPDILAGDKDTLCFGLGCIPWDIIIDFNHESRTDNGLFDNTVQYHSKHRIVKPVTYIDLQKITEDDKRLVCQGEKTIWVLADGCKDTLIKTCSNMRKTKVDIMNLLGNILSMLPIKKPVTFVTLFLSDKGISNVSIVTDSFIDVCACADERVDQENSKHIVLFTSGNHTLNTSNELSTLMARIVCLFADLYPRQNLQDRYYYSGDCYLSSNSIARWKHMLDLYHRDIGTIDFATKSGEEVHKVIQNTVSDFLRGGEITPEAFYIHNCEFARVYALRSDMIILKNNVKEELYARHLSFNFHRQQVFIVQHDPSGGGTTIARYLLYSLREEYPCILIKRIKNELVDALADISQNSQKPLLLVVDSPEISFSDILSLQKSLDNKFIKSLIVFLMQRKTGLRLEKDESKYAHYVSSQLDMQDKIKFQNLYRKVKKIIDTDQVFLFGLLAFCEYYDRLLFSIYFL